MSFIDPTAAQSTFAKFYHYQTFNKEFLTVILREQKLFCSDPHNVNDPWDCKPWFDYRPMLKDPEKREELLTFLRNTAAPEMVAHPFRLIYEDRIRKDDNELKKAVEACSRNLGTQIGMRRIYCLTPFPDSTLMWSHYASNHRGICLEFSKNNSLIGRARPVRYRKTYPEWTPQMGIEDALDLVLTKAMDWSYEREFRIIATSLDGPTKLHEKFVMLPAGALTAIILGCECQDQAEVLSLVNKHAPDLPVKRAVRVPNHYKLAIAD
jgi:hypothetical protein